MDRLFKNWRNFIAAATVAGSTQGAIAKPCLLSEARKKYSYSFGEVGKDSVSGHNQNKSMYGASMNKPVLALINLILAKEGALHNRTGKPIRKLSPKELDRLISYAGGSSWSNRVNRALSNMRRVPGKDPNNQHYYKKYSQQYGVSKSQAREVLERLGLSDTIRGVHWGGANNKQSTAGYGKFMSFLIKEKNNPDSDYHEEAKEVLSYVQKRQGGYPGYGLQKYLNKELEKAGYGKNAVKTIYGKGGKYSGTLNYSVVVNDKYVFTIYSKGSSKGKLHKQTLQAIKDNTTPENFHSPVETPETSEIPEVPEIVSALTGEEGSISSGIPIEELPVEEPEPEEPDLETEEEPPPSKPSTPGKFVHGYKRKDFPDFDFDKFYGELKGAGLGDILKDHGRDYKFGREHHKAYRALQKSKETSQHVEPETDIETASAETEDLEYELEDLEYDHEPSTEDTSNMAAMDLARAAMEAGQVPTPEDMDVVMEHILRKKYK